MAKNDKNASPTNQKSQMIKSQFYPEKPQIRREEVDFNFNFRSNTEEDGSRSRANPYLQQTPNIYQMQEEQFFEQASSQKLKSLRDALEEKMSEVYRRIHQSKDLEVDKEL